MAFFIFVGIMNIQVTITFTAFEEDWDIEKILDGRSLIDPDVRLDLISTLMEDPEYILGKSEFSFKEDKKAI